MNIPEELKYTKDHEWIRIEGEEATIGITEFASKELGDIVHVGKHEHVIGLIVLCDSGDKGVFVPVYCHVFTP